jgi:ribosomal protein S18 acetylase RimI-like enzyme
MLDQAEAWLQERNVSRVIAPYNGSFCIGFGLLTTAFEEEPILLFGWHPPYYKEYFQNSGYHPTYPFWCYIVDFSSENYRKVAQKALNNKAIKILSINKKNWNADLDEYRKLINETFKEEWEVHPHTSEEFHELFDPFKPVADPGLLLMAEVEEKLAGFCWGVPDWNPMFRSFKGKMGPIQIIKFMLKAKRYNRAGLVAIGVLPDYRGTGVAQALAITLYKRFEERGLRKAFYYPVNESNTRSRRFAESMGGTGRVMYHCYDKNLT